MTDETPAIALVGDEVEPDSIQGRAQDWRRKASVFVCQTATDYEAGVQALQRIKRARRQWKELQQPTITAAKNVYDEARLTFNKIDDELDGSYEAIRETCERWAEARRLANLASLTAASEAMMVAPAVVAEQLTERFDAAMAAGDTAKAERIMEQATEPVSELPMMPDAAILVVEPGVPKVAGASIAVPYTWELLDESKLPREYLTVDRKKITKVVKALGKEAQRLLGPGVHVRPDTQLRVREK